MASTIRAHIRRRRMQRWLRREARLLAQQAQQFDCLFTTDEADTFLADVSNIAVSDLKGVA